ncbi:hypothetical protein BGX30_006540, partial [Mortierella sp. GBA39]
MNHYPYQGQGGQGQNQYYDQTAHPSQHQHSQFQQQYDPNGYGSPRGGNGGVSAPAYSAHPVASGMMAAGGDPGNGYMSSPAFNPSYINGGGGGGRGGGGGYDNYNGNGNANYNNGTTTAYGNVPVPATGHNYQGGGLTYQQTLPSTQPGGAAGMSGQGGEDVRAQPPQPEGDYPVVMAIDFGTTFSGVAFALKADGEVHDVTKWPRHLAQYPKTPTLSLYKKDSKKILDWGHAARLAMLKPAAKDYTLLRKFKLQLDETLAAAPLENGATALQAVTDYLKKLHGYVMMELMKGMLKSFEPGQFQYCLTVPAMWSDAAKNTMRQAAIGAGLIQEGDPPNRLTLISEPEAAAMYCERKVDHFQLKDKDRFMICDAGGGTVDLIVFEVSEPPGKERHLKEVTRGHGASCGSTFLDANMEKFKRYRKTIKACGWASLMDTFVDMVKPMFNGQEDVQMQIPQATGLEDLNDPDIGLEEGVLCVSAEEMRTEVFEPVISD